MSYKSSLSHLIHSGVSLFAARHVEMPGGGAAHAACVRVRAHVHARHD